MTRHCCRGARPRGGAGAPAWLHALLLAASTGCTGSIQSQSWSEATTPHFVISNNLEHARLREVARMLEQKRGALLGVAWRGGTDPPGRTQVIAFDELFEFKHYLGQAPALGMAVRRPGDEPLLILSLGQYDEDDVGKLIAHETAHDLSQWFMPLQPAWFSEGLAMYLENVRYDAASGRATLGTPSNESISWLGESGTVIRTESLFELDSVLSSHSNARGSFYASSWLLVHYLMNRESAAFGQFQLGLTRLVPWAQAWQAAFPGLMPRDLDQRVLQYARHMESFSTVTVQLDLPLLELEQRELSEAELHGLLARLSSSFEPSVSAEELQQALGLDRDELNALVVQFRATPADQQQARLDIARRAAAAHADRAEAWLLVADALPPGDERYAALQRAERLSPAHPGVARLLAEEDARRGRMRSALAYTRLALRRSPPTPDLIALRVTALAAERRCDEARSLARATDNPCSKAGTSER